VVLKAVNIVDRESLPNNNTKADDSSVFKSRKCLLCFPLHKQTVVGLEALSANSFLRVEVTDEGAGISKVINSIIRNANH